MSTQLADALGLFNAFKEMLAPGAPVGQPAVGNPALPVNYVIQPNGSQDVVDHTLYVAPPAEIGNPEYIEPPLDDAEIQAIFGGVEKAQAEYAAFDPHSIGRAIFGSPAMDTLRARFPDFAAMGGPLDGLMNLFQGATSSSLEKLGAATKGSVSALSKAIAALDKRLTALEKNWKTNNTNVSRKVNAIEATTRQLTQKWNQQNGTGNRYQRLLLTVAQSYPGIKANRTLHDPSLVAFFDVMKRFFAALEAEISMIEMEAVPTFGASYVQADVNATLAKLLANQETLADGINAIAGILNELIEEVRSDEAHKKSAETFHSYISNRTMIDQVAELLPTQIQDQTEAMWQVGAKFVLAKPSAAGTGVLGALGI